jgi:hypothetical protein
VDHRGCAGKLAWIILCHGDVTLVVLGRRVVHLDRGGCAGKLAWIMAAAPKKPAWITAAAP